MLSIEKVELFLFLIIYIIFIGIFSILIVFTRILWRGTISMKRTEQEVIPNEY